MVKDHYVGVDTAKRKCKHGIKIGVSMEYEAKQIRKGKY